MERYPFDVAAVLTTHRVPYDIVAYIKTAVG